MLKKACLKLISASLILGCIGSANAYNTESSSLQEPDNVLYYIEVQSEQEYQDLVTEIDAHNERAQALWAKALEEGTEAPVSSPISTYSYTKSDDVPIYVGKAGVLKKYLYAYITFDQVTAAGGYPMFGGFYDFNVYSQSDTVSVSGVDYEKGKYLDSGRTLPVNVSGVVGIKSTSSSSWNYKSFTSYIEFYASGVGHCYD